MTQPPNYVHRLSARELSDRYVGVVLDLDGVCYLGGVEIPGVSASVKRLRDAGIEVRFVTNNSTRTPDDVVVTLQSVGIEARREDVITSSMAAAALLPPGTRCLAIGMEGLRTALAERGCPVTEDPADAQAVVVGMDTDLTWEKLCRATLALDRGACFIGTNADVSFPSAEGLWPGNGAILAALTAATGIEPEVAAKPHAPLFEQAASTVPEGRLLMVGDRLDTDIHGAQRLGWDTLLVLSGIADGPSAAAADPPPTYVSESLAVIGP